MEAVGNERWKGVVDAVCSNSKALCIASLAVLAAYDYIHRAGSYREVASPYGLSACALLVVGFTGQCSAFSGVIKNEVVVKTILVAASAALIVGAVFQLMEYAVLEAGFKESLEYRLSLTVAISAAIERRCLLVYQMCVPLSFVSRLMLVISSSCVILKAGGGDLVKNQDEVVLVALAAILYFTAWTFNYIYDL